ncbi:hypothetical protein ACFXCZ_31885 [Streptomyces sp. NPDC059396]|uniref:hypothetical protein n=1 Tax=Streptomyces sp. NPDC059396 TaxID=3346819 RepID=UPI00368EB55D
MSKKKSDTAAGCGCLAVLALIGVALLGSCGDEPTTKNPTPTATAKPVTELPSEKDDSNSDSSGSGGGGSQPGIEFGQHCAPVGALGTSWDGRPAECFMGKDGRLRWGYDSDRG